MDDELRFTWYVMDLDEIRMRIAKFKYPDRGYFLSGPNNTKQKKEVSVRTLCSIAGVYQSNFCNLLAGRLKMTKAKKRDMANISRVITMIEMGMVTLDEDGKVVIGPPIRPMQPIMKFNVATGPGGVKLNTLPKPKRKYVGAFGLPTFKELFGGK